jgi:hypothetical protein
LVKKKVPWNKGKKGIELENARRKKIVICPTCKKKVFTKYDSQKYCNKYCYFKSPSLIETSRNSYLIKNNKKLKWRKGTGGKSFSNKGSFKKGDKRIVGENNPRWKGGITKLQEKLRKIKEYKKWRESIFKRDDWTCQMCEKRGVYLEAHHLVEFNRIIKIHNITTLNLARNCEDLWKKSNGLTLCRKCHNLTKSKYFKNE